MKKREAEFGKLFRHWLRANPLPSAAFELKQTTTNSIPFDAVQPHQIAALEAARTKEGLLFKGPDDSRGVKPCDYFYLAEAMGVIVIRFPECFCLIHVHHFVEERDIYSGMKRKSLTVGRAKTIAFRTVEL